MKIIEALKQIKDLKRKADDIIVKIRQHSADMDYESPIYSDQKAKILEWLQAHRDLTQAILSLRFRIQKTNVNTKVTVFIGDNEITKSIAEWIHRRKDLSKMEKEAWDALTDKGLKDQKLQQSNGGVQELRVRRYYDPAVKDLWQSKLASEPSLIDAKLEIVNAITDLLE